MTYDICKELGNNVKKLRKAAGYSQESFAEKIEIGTTSLSLIETGKGFVSARTLAKIAEVLNVEVFKLFFVSNDYDLDEFYENITKKVEKYKKNKEKLLLLDAFLNVL